MENLPSLRNWDNSLTNVRFPSQEEIKISNTELDKYLKNIQNNEIFSTDKPYEDKDYSRYALKRVIARGCIFKNCLFIKTAGTGSIWSDSGFLEQCDFSESNFEFADFIKCKFIGENKSFLKIIGASFSSSNFSYTKLNNVQIQGCSFSQVDFSNAEIENCDIASSTFENAIFHKATLTNLKLSNLNIEYSDFKDAIFNNVEFALSQFAYIFGLDPDDIMNGKIKITVNEVGESQMLSVDELSDVSNHLITYFLSKNNYFPVANLYLMFKREKEFKSIIELAIKSTLLEKNYRELKYLIKLVYLSNYFSTNDKNNLFQLIETLQYEQTEHNEFTQPYLKHKAEIESFLIPKVEEEFLIEFILNNKLDLGVIQKIFDYYQKAQLILEWSNLLFSQNSPIKFKALLHKHKTEISIFLQFTAVIFSGIGAINSFTDKDLLDNEKKEIAIYVNNTYINKMDIDNFAVRYNSNYLLKYDEHNNNI